MCPHRDRVNGPWPGTERREINWFSEQFSIHLLCEDTSYIKYHYNVTMSRIQFWYLKPRRKFSHDFSMNQKILTSIIESEWVVKVLKPRLFAFMRIWGLSKGQFTLDIFRAVNFGCARLLCIHLIYTCYMVNQCLVLYRFSQFLRNACHFGN